MPDSHENNAFEATEGEPNSNHTGPASEASPKLQAGVDRLDGAPLDRLAWVRHEVRTPLGAIASIADLLQTTSLDAMQHRLLETLKLSVQSISTIVDDLLDEKNGDNDCFSCRPERFDIRSLLANLAITLTAQAQRKGLAATVKIAETCPNEIIGDAVRIGQVLNNLIGNALKFTDSGSVDLAVSPRQAENGANFLLFEIVDTGKGLPAAKADMLFEPYVSLPGGGGSDGLGLAIAKQLVQQMGGEIGCEQRQPQGCLFWFTIALEPIATSEESHPAHLSTCPAVLKGHVLIVEDNAINQVLVATMVKQFGLTFDMAANGSEALQAVSAKNYDLILMDTLMLDMDGLEATRQIRRMAGAKAQIPIIALTAKTMDGDREEHLEAGANCFVPKPIQVDALYTAIGQTLHENGSKSTESLAS